MHIVMVSDAETQGGAAIAASRLAEAFCHSGCQVTRLVASPDGQQHLWQTHNLSLSYPLPPAQRVAWHLLPDAGRERLGNHLLRDLLHDCLTKLRPDGINIHNLHLTSHPRWSPAILRACATHAPTVWTLHDMWSFTGRCVYSHGCEKFINGCDADCPTAEDYPTLPRRWIAQGWQERRDLLQGVQKPPKVAAVSPSHWLARQAQRGLWAGHRVEVIRYGLNLELYRPIDRSQARARLGLPPSGRMLLFAAQNLTDPRKGWPPFRDALTRLSRRPATLLVMGNGELPERIGAVEVRRLSYVRDEAEKVLIYNAADLLVHPAPYDNFPLVVAEALSCGVPVAAFATGGLTEMVFPGRTGWLSDEIAPEAFAAALDNALDELERGCDLRDECRQFAEATFGFIEQAQGYLSLFTSLRQAGRLALP